MSHGNHGNHRNKVPFCYIKDNLNNLDNFFYVLNRSQTP